jgi:vitamin B12 transporter
MQRLSISLIALLAALPASAQTVIELDEIVVTANRTATDAKRTGVSVDVVNKDDLRASGTDTVANYLNSLPGVTVTTQGPVGNTTSLRIRGADKRYIVVYVDGIRVTDPTQTETSFDFGSLLAADIARIEVLRGSQSALWGGSAVGGVINIESHERLEEDGQKQDVLVELGSDATAILSYGLTQKQGRLETAFSSTRYQTDGFSAAATGTEDDPSDATRLSFSARYAMTDALSIGGAAFTQETNSSFDGFPPPLFVLTDLPNTEKKNEYGARLFAELDTGRTQHLFDLTYFRVTRDIVDVDQGNSYFAGDRWSLGWNATTEISSSLSAVYGIDTMEEGAKYARIPGGSTSTTTIGGFAQMLWAPTDTFDVSATLRHDDNSSYGGFTTGRLAASWRPTESTTLRAAIATGYRAPSIDELFGNYTAGSFPFVGNPALTPEESLSYEIGVDQELSGGGTLSATLFRLETDNLIALQNLFPAVSTLANTSGTSVRQGVELSAELPLSASVDLTGAYTYTDARKPNGEPLARIPLHQLTVSLNADLGNGWNGSLGLTHASGAEDGFSGFQFDADDYTVYRAQVGYDIGQDRELYLRVENLTDEVYEVVDGFATPRRSVHLGLRASF